MKRLSKHVHLAALWVCLISVPAEAADTAMAAVVITLQGQVTAATADGTIRALAKDSTVHSGDTVVTGPNALVRLKFTDDGFVVLRPNTRFLIEDYHVGVEAEEDRSVFSLLKGGFRALTGLVGQRSRERYQVKTTVATIGIRGTDYTVRHCDEDCEDVSPVPPNGTFMGVDEGTTTIDSGAGPQEVAAGQFGYVPGAGQPLQYIPGYQAGAVMGFPPADCGG